MVVGHLKSRINVLLFSETMRGIVDKFNLLCFSNDTLNACLDRIFDNGIFCIEIH